MSDKAEGAPPQGQAPPYGQPLPGAPQYTAPGQPVYTQPGYGPPPGYTGQPGAPPGYAGQPYGYAGHPGMPMGGPIPGQPAPVQWMQRPAQITGCPPGLEYLTQIDQIMVKQQIELLEIFTNWETKNKYKIVNSMGQQVYYAAEESDACTRQCCGPNRSFDMHVTDNLGQEVLRVHREFKCCALPCCACCDACSHQITVEAPVGQTVGFVKQLAGCQPRFSIQNAQEEEVLQITGPFCICQGPCCTWDQDFIVHNAGNDAEVGKISKQWSGLMREYFTDADNFGVSFPMDLDVKVKATMLGCVFLIDFMYFEQQQNNHQHHY